MKKLLLTLLLSCLPALAQVSGVGQLGCNGAPVTGSAWTSGTSNNTAQTLVGPNSPLPGALVIIDQTTTISGGVVTFQEDYGDGNLINVESWRIYTPATPALIGNPYTLVASTNQPFFINLAGIHKLTLKLTTAITGSATITPFTTAWCGVSPLTPIDNRTLVGTTIDVNSGSKSAGTQRVVIATDQPALTNKLLVTPDSVALPANQSVNVNQIGSSAVDTNGGNKSNGTQRMIVATDQPALGGLGVAATGGAPPSNASYQGGLGSGATGGFLIGTTVCELNKVVNISTATTTLLVTGVSGRQVRICAFHIFTAGANNVAMIEGTGATCGTGSAGLAGGTTAASGYNFAANSGIAQGTGIGEVMTTATTGDSVCVVTSAAVQLSGFIKYTIY